MCFKELSLFIKDRQGFLWNTKKYIQDIYNSYTFLTPKTFSQILPPIPNWFAIKLQKILGAK